MLQKFKTEAAEFDHTKSEYAGLLNFDLNKYKVDENAAKEV